MNKIYPFKFLDSYDKNDTGLFFGRDEEIDALYQMIFESNILMVYGASGTGKTSLIQCGLAGRFQPHDWLALYIRRGTNLNDSFEQAIADAGRIADAKDLEMAFKAVYRNSFRPLYLIFDQFEELFILGTKDEQAKFIQTVKAILSVEQPVKMIFSIREEYLGQLYDFEKEVPQLMRRKLRVEPMNEEKVGKVIRGAAGIKGSVISLKSGEESGIVTRIFNKVKGKDKDGNLKKGPIQLPYLQVFLDKLYMVIADDEEHKKEAVFTIDAVDRTGEIDDILRNFLEEQVKKVTEDMVKLYASVTVDYMWRMLSHFVSIDGTKAPMKLQALQSRLAETDIRLLQHAVSAFVDGRILRYTEEGDIYELAHDALAGKIAGKRSEEEVALLELERMIKTQVAMKKEARGLLQENQLTLISLYIKKLEPRLNEADKDFIEKSKDKVRADERIALEHIADMARKTREAQSLALSSAATINRYVVHDFTRTFAFARYAYEKNPGNLDAQTCIYAAVFKDESKPEFLFYQHTLRHEGIVNSAVFSPDGKKVLTTSLDGTAKIWDAVTGKEIATFEERLADQASKVYSIASAAFSPDGNRVVTAFGGITAKIWNAETGKEIATLSGHNRAVVWAAFSPDGKRIVTASYDATAKIWDATTGKEIATLKGDNGEVYSAEFSPDSKKVVTKSRDVAAKIWDAARGKEIATIAGGAGFFASAAFSPDGESVILPSSECTIAKIYDTTKGEEIGTLGAMWVLMSATFAPDGRSVVTASHDKTAKIWNPTPNGTEMEVIATLEGHTACVNSAEFSPDGGKIVTASKDKTAKVWNGSTGIATTLAGHTESVTSAKFSPCGEKVVTASNDGTAKLWDITSKKETILLAGYTSNVTSAAFSPDGKKVVTTVSDDSAVKIWDALTGTEIAALSGRTDGVRLAVFSQDGKRIVTESEDSTVKIWDALTGSEIATLPRHSSDSTVCSSPDGKRVAITFFDDKTVELWDATTGKGIAILAFNSTIYSTVFSPDSQRLATTEAESNAARIWDADTGKEITTMVGHLNPALSAAFSLDGKKLVTASSDWTSKIWDAATGIEMATLAAHGRTVNSAVFSPDGKRVATASKDNTAKIWDSVSGKIIANLIGHTNEVISSAFSPDGNSVITSSEDSTTKLWDAATGKELASLAGYGYVGSAAFSTDGEKVIMMFDSAPIKICDISIPSIIKDMEGKIDDLSPEEKAKYGIADKK